MLFFFFPSEYDSFTKKKKKRNVELTVIAVICRIVSLDALFFRRSYDFYGCI